MAALESDNIVTLLSQTSFFSDVSTASLKFLVKDIEEEVFVANQSIFKKGDPGDALYAIVEGTVNVHEGDHSYGTLSVGDCFGEYALIDEKTRSASVTAKERTIALKIERDHFLNLMARDQGFSQGILAVMIKRHRELDQIQERLARSKRDLELASSRMNALIKGAMDAIIMFDTNFRIVMVNPSAEKLLQNTDVVGRNVLFFFDEQSADLIAELIDRKDDTALNTYLPSVVKVLGSEERETLNEGTISKYGSEEATFYTLILRNIDDRLVAEDTINLLTKQTQYLEEEIKELTSSYGIIAQDIGMKNVLNLIDQVASTDATVLITGETGTGKELVARAIHKSSARNDKALIRINCGAIPSNLIESELFGHEKGAFTGATADRKGRFLLADGGTIFLDEIGELPLELQPKLLRVIQEGEFDPVGSSQTLKVDVRIIAATHRDLLEHAREQKFREDLYYRLNVFPISVPPLRSRGGDICLIAEQMIDQFSKRLNKERLPLTEQDKELLINYPWPGNVRELQNLIERAVIVSDKGVINWQNILPKAPIDGEFKKDQQSVQNVMTSKELINFEKENIRKALRITRWKVSGKGGAAELLNIPATTLASKIKSFGIERPV